MQYFKPFKRSNVNTTEHKTPYCEYENPYKPGIIKRGCLKDIIF